MKLVKSIVFSARMREPDPAIAFPGGVASYGALIKSVEAAVEALRTLGLEPGTAVMLDIGNPIHHTAMIFALALLGLPSASVGTAFAAEQAGFVPKVFLTDRSEPQAASTRVVKIDERWFAADPAARPNYRRLLALPGFARADDIVRYVYSSGTTGHPKCVGLTQACLELRALHGQMRTPWWMHAPAGLNMMGFSTIMGIMSPLGSHAEGRLLCYAGSAADAVHMLNLFRVGGLAVTVGQLQALFKVLGDQPPPVSLHYVAIAGARVGRELLTEARARLCDTAILGYASTEMGSISSALATGTDTPDGYAGQVLPWVEVQAVDEARRPLACGREGLLRVRTPELAVYVDAEGRPVEMGDDGWFYPGDIGRLAEDGTLTIAGRAGEVINRGGLIVAPEAIEEVLRLDRRVADVAVVAVPTADGIDEIWAAVVADGEIDPQAIADAARPRLNEKLPDRIVQVHAIPRAESAKVKRGELREMLLARVRDG